MRSNSWTTTTNLWKYQIELGGDGQKPRQDTTAGEDDFTLRSSRAAHMTTTTTTTAQYTRSHDLTLPIVAEYTVHIMSPHQSQHSMTSLNVM